MIEKILSFLFKIVLAKADVIFDPLVGYGRQCAFHSELLSCFTMRLEKLKRVSECTCHPHQGVVTHFGQPEAIDARADAIDASTVGEERLRPEHNLNRPELESFFGIVIQENLATGQGEIADLIRSQKNAKNS